MTSRSIDISPCHSIGGSIRVPGDKSISHRALLVAAMGEGRMTVRGLSPSADVASSLGAISALGVRPSHSQDDVERWRISSQDRDFQILLDSQGLGSLAAPGTIDVGNSGTTIRLLAGILAGSRVAVTLDGDDSIRRRPMGRVIRPLRAMGARIDAGENERAPFTVHGSPLRGVRHELQVSSAQVKSALLLAGLTAEGETTVQEPSRSRDHTERLLRYLKVPIHESPDGLSVSSTNIRNASVTVPGDLSSAAFFLVAAAVLPDGDVTITDVGVNPTRTGILEILRRYGAAVSIEDERAVCGEPVGTVRVRAGDRRALDVSGSLVVDAIDELPLLGVLGAFAEGETRLADARELRVKESDRIAAVVDLLTRMGADAEATPDGFVVRGPARLRGARIDPRGDHRIAMAAAVAALGAEKTTTVEDWACVGVSYPGFAADLDRLRVG